MRKLLVTGHTGFVGRTVTTMLGDGSSRGWAPATFPDDCDIRSPEIEGHVQRIAPDSVLHLAGLTSVADSFRQPERFFDVNLYGTWNLLKALRGARFSGRLLFVSSGDCYGAIPADALPVAEDFPLRPRNPYAVSKVAAEALCYQWSQTESFEIVLARSFNHIGPGQDRRFALASFAEQVARIGAGLAPPRIMTGDLSVTRDLTDVRDVVRAYFALLERGRSGEAYNVGSGKETRLADVLAMLTELAGLHVETVVDPARLRADEQRRAMADVRKIAADTGWSASTPLRSTLHDTLDDWRRRITP
ncbi:MAG TPA: GDP-mannose 4,6-dehydratase [Casimicrobiaceae bacterium]|nr:GDP-mannose 4,6-dehydratase [Casimicrobiaceae bacterium]